MKIERIIEDLNQEFIRRGKYFVLLEEGNVSPNPSHINNGFCYCYAASLKKKLADLGIESQYHEVEKNSIPHAFIEVNGKFFDSETPNGVDCWEELPLYNDFKSLEKKVTPIPY